MQTQLAVWLLDLSARLPLSWLHRFGAALGWLTYRFSASYAERLRENLGYEWANQPRDTFQAVLNASVSEAGKSIAELPWIWRRPLTGLVASVRQCEGWEHVDAALSRGKGLIFLTPHLGCFEIAALYTATRIPLTVLYRPPKLTWLEPLMRSGRERGQVHLARTDIGGVRTLFKALKRGEAIGLLPDQVPGKGEGEWVEFFDRPAYTMTLVERLIRSTDAAVLMTHAERLPQGAGYTLRFSPLSFDATGSITRQVNAAVEDTVRACPAQYLWSYNRYKVPAGVEPPVIEKGN